jgi:anti-sigma B factor antagonist
MSATQDVYARCSLERPAPGWVVVRIDGELDACSVPAVEGELGAVLTPDCRKLVLDLTGLTFIDSTGIRLLLQVIRRKDPATDLAAVVPSRGTVWRALEMVGVTQLLPVSETLPDALGAHGNEPAPAPWEGVR